MREPYQIAAQPYVTVQGPDGGCLFYDSLGRLCVLEQARAGAHGASVLGRRWLPHRQGWTFQIRLRFGRWARAADLRPDERRAMDEHGLVGMPIRIREPQPTAAESSPPLFAQLGLFGGE